MDPANKFSQVVADVNIIAVGDGKPSDADGVLGLVYLRKCLQPFRLKL